MQHATTTPALANATGGNTVSPATATGSATAALAPANTAGGDTFKPATAVCSATAAPGTIGDGPATVPATD